MDTITENLCEEPIYVFITLAIAVLVLGALWHSSRKKLYLKLIAAPVVLAIAVFAMDYFIIMDREQIQDASREIATDLETGRVDAAGYYLDDKYFGYLKSKPLLMKFAQVQLKNLKIIKVHLSHDTIHVTGKQADMTVTSVLTFDGEYKGKTALKWEIHWVKRPQGWRIDEVSAPQRTVPGFN